jgi:glycine/D-amino acid oxidase-like deaminating enzyme/nitrite reductase/ring-hydroxylating ferredoxin subunit
MCRTIHFIKYNDFMKRDGQNKSVWQDMQYYQPQRRLLLPSETDTIVVGGGMTGIVTALTLQQAGRNVLLLEAHNLGFGTTGGTTAHLNTLMDTPYSTITKNFSQEASRTVASAAAEAIQTIKSNIKEYQIDCDFEDNAAYLFSQDEKEDQALTEIADHTKQAGVMVEYVNQIPISTPFTKAIRVPGQGKFNPLKYLFALAAAFEEKGGNIITNCAVTDLEEHDGRVHLTTTFGQIAASKVVFATHIPIGINLIHLRCAPWRSYAMAVKLGDGQYPQGLIYDMKDPYHYYRTQMIGGQPVLIAGGKDHKTGDCENTETPFLHLRTHIEKIFKVQEVTHHWSSQYFESTDGLPYIGVLPGYSNNVLVATGFGGNGMIYSHVSARELSALVGTEESLFGNLFSPARIKPVAGFTNFIGHNADVVKNFVGKWFSSEKLESLAGLSPGEGKVVSFEGTRVALSKDAQGVTHAVSPDCTHLKCGVAWNDTEQTWDCPCHGARYSAQGKVVTGPASHDLEEIKLTELIMDKSEKD